MQKCISVTNQILIDLFKETNASRLIEEAILFYIKYKDQKIYTVEDIKLLVGNVTGTKFDINETEILDILGM